MNSVQHCSGSLSAWPDTYKLHCSLLSQVQCSVVHALSSWLNFPHTKKHHQLVWVSNKWLYTGCNVVHIIFIITDADDAIMKIQTWPIFASRFRQGTSPTFTQGSMHANLYTRHWQRAFNVKRSIPKNIHTYYELSTYLPHKTRLRNTVWTLGCPVEAAP